MNLARALAAALRWHAVQRGRSFFSRVALALAVTGAAFATRVLGTEDQLGFGRDLLLLGVLLAALLFGLVPGLCAAVLARGLSIWWYVGPNGEALVPPWYMPGIALILAMAVLAAALAGQTLQLLAHPEDEEDSAALTAAPSPSGTDEDLAVSPRREREAQPATVTSR